MFDDEDKSLTNGFNGDQENHTLQLISNEINTKNIIKNDSKFSASDEPFYEIMNDEELMKTTTTAVPGTPAARATN